MKFDRADPSLLVVAGRKGNDPGERGGIALEKSIKNSSDPLFFH